MSSRGSTQTLASGDVSFEGRHVGECYYLPQRQRHALKSLQSERMLNASGKSEGFAVEVLGNSRPVEKLTVSEAEVITGVKKTDIHRLLDDGHFNELWLVDDVSGRRLLDLDLCVFVKFHEGDGRLLARSARHMVWTLFVEAVHSLRSPLGCDLPDQNFRALHFVLSDALSVDLTPHCQLVMSGWDKLRKSRAEIQVDPSIRAGMPVVAGTRIGAYEVADVVESAGMNEALEMFPSLTLDRIEAALIYAKTHPRPGRPSKWDHEGTKKRRLKSSHKFTRSIG